MACLDRVNRAGQESPQDQHGGDEQRIAVLDREHHDAASLGRRRVLVEAYAIPRVGLVARVAATDDPDAIAGSGE